MMTFYYSGNSRLLLFRRLFARVIAILLCTVPLPVWAHPMPRTVVLLDIQQKQVLAELQLPLGELQLAFGHDVAVHPESLIQRLGKELKAYITAHMRPASPEGQPWQVEVQELSISRAEQVATGSYQELVAQAVLTPPPGAGTRNFVFNYDVIIHQLVTHKAMVNIRQDWETGVHGEQTVELGIIGLDVRDNVIPPMVINQAPGSAWRGFTSMVNLGIHHIADGTDHLLFLLVLLLPAPLVPVGKRWGPFGGTRYSVIRLLKIVTAFTVGHSLTLIAGAFGWLHVPSQPVEILIAFSILVSAAHAMYPLFSGREALVAGGFGLIHGSAFAGTLTDLHLETSRMVLSILGFNTGIELMQLFVILLIIPSLILLSKTSLYPFIRLSGAALASLAATGWIAERVSGKSNLLTTFVQNITGFAPYAAAWFAVVALCSLFLTRKVSSGNRSVQ